MLHVTVTLPLGHLPVLPWFGSGSVLQLQLHLASSAHLHLEPLNISKPCVHLQSTAGNRGQLRPTAGNRGVGGPALTMSESNQIEPNRTINIFSPPIRISNLGRATQHL
jgi:hypothetical protein